MSGIGGKTKDGVKFKTIADILDELDGVKVRPGSKHRLVIIVKGLAPRVFGTSSSAHRIAENVAEVTDYSKKDIYSAFKAGRWYK